ncbi:MAG TPA: hypothetical protein VGS16_00905 [Candidatus Dormibacteraeota bacterium]|nr:hypothetical protein [Candidatus Dormibacteraeota bacterium]
MGKVTVLLVALILAACSPASQATVRPSPSRVANSSPVATPTIAANPSPTSATTPGAFDLPLSTVGFSCRLPIMTPDSQGAFVSFPAATASLDPQGRPPVDHWGLYYDRAFSRWLPVPRQAVSPDGKHYAYGERGADQTQVARMHVVDIVSGTDHVFSAPTGAWFIRFSNQPGYPANGCF